MRRTTVLSVLALLALTGCSTEVRGSASPAEVVAPPTTGSPSTSAPSTGAPAPSAPAGDPGPGSPASGTAAFGTTVEYDDGLTVTVSPPQPYTPSESAYIGGPAPASFVAFDVTVLNGTAADFEPTLLFSLQSGSTSEEQLFDSGGGLDGTPYQTLLPGRSVAFRIGFGASDPADLVLEVTPGFEYEPVSYTS